MKKLYASVVLLCMLITLIPGELAHAAPAARLFLDGQPLASDVPPTIVNNRTLVPLRVIMEALGASVNWISNSQPILIRKGTTEIQVQVGKNQAQVNGKVITLDVAPQIMQNRAMVPLRFIGESLGAGIWWEPTSRSVYITSPTGQLQPGELLQEAGVVKSLRFQSTRPMDIGPLEISADGREVTLEVKNVATEPASQPVSNSDLVSFNVEPLDGGSARIRLAFGERAKFLLPQARLSDNNQTLTLSWPVTLKQVSFRQLGGVEQLIFPLPESVKPVITDTTVETETRGSLPGRIIVTDGANVRAHPSTEADKIGLVPYNGTVEVVGVTTGWYEVRLSNNVYGWIADWLVAVETEIETKEGVNVRSSPSTASKANIITVLYPGHKIRVLQRLDGWCYVEYGTGKKGYIADYLVPLESRLIDSQIVPGISIRFPGVGKSSQLGVAVEDSGLFATAEWKEDADGTTLLLQLKQPISYRLNYSEEGWQLTFGTWVEELSFASTEKGPRVRFTLDGPSQPSIKYSSAEESIILTIPGASLGPEVKSSIVGDGVYVEKITAEQAGSEVRMKVKLPRTLAYHLQKVGDAKWELAIASPTLVGKLIAIDPGHGATDPGATGKLGWNEADYTHDIAYRLRDLLTQAGANVLMTRLYESGPIQGPARAAKINAAGADLMISIHINSSTNKSARGIETWYYPRGDNAYFARLVQDSLMAELGYSWPDRGIKSGSYIICRDTLTTGAMAELGFISNATDESLLYQAEIRQRMAQALFNAIEKYFAR